MRNKSMRVGRFALRTSTHARTYACKTIQICDNEQNARARQSDRTWLSSFESFSIAKSVEAFFSRIIVERLHMRQRVITWL